MRNGDCVSLFACKGEILLDNIRYIVGIVFLTGVFLPVFSLQTGSAQEIDPLPTKQNPLMIDSRSRRVLIYTEVNEKGDRKISAHFGVVYKEGKLAEKALLKAYVNPLEFHDALINIGAKPGNNLTDDSRGKYVEGDRLEITVTWPGLNKEIPFKDILTDSGGRGFEIRFGGNRISSAAENSGCLTCLESCWVGITSNAAYPVASSLRRFFSPNSQFSINRKVLSAAGGDPVILIYSIKKSK